MWSRFFGVVVGVSGGISNVVSFISSVLIRHRRYKRYKYRLLRNMVFYGHECSHEIRCGADLFKRSHSGITNEVQRHYRRSPAALQRSHNGMINEIQQHKQTDVTKIDEASHQRPAFCARFSVRRQARRQARKNKTDKTDW